MEEQMIGAPLIMPEPSHHSSGILGILRENLRISEKYTKVMVLNILLVLLPFCLLALGADLALTPVMVNLTSKLTLLSDEDPNCLEAKETIQGILKDVRLLLGLEMIFVVGFCIVSLLSLLATFYTRKELSMKELFTRMGATSKRVMISWFYMTIIGVVLVVLVLILIGVFSVTITGLDLIVLSVMGVILGTLGYIYFVAVWMLSLVMSIVKEDFYELMVLGRAEELVKGRKLQGFVLMLLSSIVSIAITVAFSSNNSEINVRTGTPLENKIVVFCLFFLVKVFLLFVYTVFYIEGKRRQGEQVEVEGRLGYSPVAISVV